MDIRATVEGIVDHVGVLKEINGELLEALKKLRAHEVVQSLCDVSICGCSTSVLLEEVDDAIERAETF